MEDKVDSLMSDFGARIDAIKKISSGIRSSNLRLIRYIPAFFPFRSLTMSRKNITAVSTHTSHP